MRTITRRTLVGGLILILVAGCGTATSPSPAATPVPTQTPVATPRGSDATSGVHSAAEAWGEIELVKLAIPLGGDRHFLFDNAGTPDGRYLLGVDEPNARAAGEPSYDDAAYLVMYEVASGSLRQIAELTSHHSQVLSVSSDGEWVAWIEAADDPVFFDWRLRSYNIGAGEVKLVAKAERSNGEPVPGPVSPVSVDNAVAVWGQAIGEGAGSGRIENAVIRQVDLRTGEITTIARSAGVPVLSWPWIAWAAADGGNHIQVTNRETGFSRQLDITPPQFALHHASAAYNDQSSLSISLIEDLATAEPAIVIARGVNAVDHVEWPTLNDRIVGWAQTMSTAVYDRAEQRLVALPMPDGQRSLVSIVGPLMVWAQMDPSTSPYRGWSDWLMVLDTRGLPIR